jgi:hypothetical protein
MAGQSALDPRTEELLGIVASAREERLAAMGFDQNANDGTGSSISCNNYNNIIPGSRVVTPLGTGYITSANSANSQVSVELDSGYSVDTDACEVLVIANN